MFKSELIKNILTQMIGACSRVERRFSTIESSDQFLDDEAGLEKLDAICMQLIAIGESVKNLDKETDKQLLSKYPSISWKEVAGLRDIISHHYFDLNAEIIFDVCQNHIKPLKKVLEQIFSDVYEIDLLGKK
ncbi:MAG: HepT-like ribonuclease domain-containing protein [Sulfuricurvum sp.]